MKPLQQPTKQPYHRHHFQATRKHRLYRRHRHHHPNLQQSPVQISPWSPLHHLRSRQSLWLLQARSKNKNLQSTTTPREILPRRQHNHLPAMKHRCQHHHHHRKIRLKLQHRMTRILRSVPGTLSLKDITLLVGKLGLLVII